MKGTTRPHHALSLVLLLGGSGTVLMTLSSDVWQPRDSTVTARDDGGARTERVQRRPTDFGISGDVRQLLVPGVMVPIELTLTNDAAVPLGVTELKVRVASVDSGAAATACRPQDFITEAADLGGASLSLGSGASSTLGALGLARSRWPRIGIAARASADDRCRNVSVSLSYAGTAIPVIP